MNNHKVPALTPAVLLPVARREPERSESDRSATGSKTGPEANPHPDPEVVAQAINDLLDNPLECSRLGQNAQRVARDRYSLARMASDTERVYREVLAGA